MMAPGGMLDVFGIIRDEVVGKANIPGEFVEIALSLLNAEAKVKEAAPRIKEFLRQLIQQ